MKLLDDPKIPTVRQNPRRPHHSHKPLDVAAEMGLEPGRPYCTRRRHHHLSIAPTNFDIKTGNKALKIGMKPSHRRGPRSTMPPWPKGHTDLRPAAAPAGGNEI
jgi:hypothetical protein